MGFIIDLWLPILLSAVFIFIASSTIHMVLPIHKKDYKKLNDEDEVLAAIRAHHVQPGDYAFPFCCDMKAMESEEMKTRFNQGPVGFMTILPSGPWKMGASMIQWFLFNLVVATFIAYLAQQVLPRDAEYMTVFRFVATAGILPYALGGIPNSIWRGLSWGTTGRFIFDGVVYALVTAGAFAWLW